ncbi:MAG TPA: response regulator [Methylomirabilota bacterium]|nr:response regulator [Methylomirabilota bacterium]
MAVNRGGAETILVVDDEPEVRSLARDILEARGYRVLEAGDGEDALRILEAATAPVHLVLTDVVMERVTGRELADRLKILRPGLPVLFMSGHAAEVIQDYGVVVPAADFVAKPFSIERLVAKVREKLGRPSPFVRPPSRRPS